MESSEWKPPSSVVRMLKRMGYKGGGLGKNGKGMNHPVLPHVRPPQLGLGFPLPKPKVSRQHRPPGIGAESSTRTGTGTGSSARPGPFAPTLGTAPMLLSMAYEREKTNTKTKSPTMTNNPTKSTHPPPNTSSMLANSTTSSTSTNKNHANTKSTRKPSKRKPTKRTSKRSSDSQTQRKRKQRRHRHRPTHRAASRSPPEDVPRGKEKIGVLVDRIPARFRSRDLRSFFSPWVQAEGFNMFHYKHRPSQTDPKLKMCLAIVPSAWAEAFVKAYDGATWVNKLGEEGPTLATLSIVPLVDTNHTHTQTTKRRHLSRRERRDELQQALQHENKTLTPLAKATKFGEMSPPPGLPQGFVGTPDKTLLKEASSLPSGLLGRLGVTPYATTHPGRFAWLYENHPLDFDSKHTAKREAQAYEDTHVQEEWDRHLSLDPVLDDGRALGKVTDERLFESKVDNPWDKHGAEGLVLYTDAFYWDQQKGGFDERVTDAWDVEGDR
ncbi:hypothetical protein AAMO2058_001456000 [Amorphochlora amoebiformis]